MVHFFLTKRLAFLSVLVLLFVSMTGQAGGMVLCVMPGGHIAFEGVSEGCCDPSHVQTHGTASVSNSGEAGDECGSCVDIPLPGIDSCISAGNGPALSIGPPAGKIITRALQDFAAKACTEGSHHQKTRLMASVRSVSLRI